MKYYICVTPFFPSEESFRGPFVLDQVRTIERNSDLKVVVFKPCSWLHKEEDYEFDGVKVYRFTDYTLPSNIYPNPLTDKLSYNSFKKKLRHLNVDPKDIVAIHAHTTNLASYAVRLKRDYPHLKTIIQHHGFDVMAETNGRLANFEWHKKLCRKYGAKLCSEVDLNVGVSKETLEYVKAVEGVKLRDEYVLYNGVDTSVFRPQTLDRETLESRPQTIDEKTLDLRSETLDEKTSDLRRGREFVIGCVGNFWELKDQITLIRAVEKIVAGGSWHVASGEELLASGKDYEQHATSNTLPAIKVRFVGTGYTRKGCEEYVREHGLMDYFEFIDEIKHNKLPEFYRGLDLFVLPSYYEAFGCVYTEAYACGVPFIGVKGQGISEIIAEEDKDNWLIEKGDSLTLSNLINKLIDNPKKSMILTKSVNINNLIKDYLTYIA